MRASTLVRSTLVGCVLRPAGDPPDLLDEVVDRQLVARLAAAAVYHRVVGYVDRHLEGRYASAEAMALWARRELAARWHREVLAELSHAAGALDAVGIPAAVLKGPVLVERYHGEPGLRTYHDLDLLVEPAGFAAVEALESGGYQLRDRNWHLLRRRLAGQVHVARPGRPEVDLHWSLLFGSERRAVFDLPARDLLARARSARVGSVDALVLGPEDTLLQVCLHAGQEGADRLVWLLDAHLVVDREAIDWDELVRRATTYRVHLAVAAVLSRSAATFGTALPTEAMRALAPRWWLRLLAGSHSLFPPAGSSGRGDPGTLLVRSTRASIPGTLRAAAAGAVTRTAAAARWRTSERLDVRNDPAHPGSPLFPAGGERDRAAYLGAVAEAGSGQGTP